MTKSHLQIPTEALRALVPTGRQVLIPFPTTRQYPQSVGDVRRWVTGVHADVLPLGLLFWGATDKTFVHEIKVGNQLVGSVTDARIPARYFETGQSFERIQGLADRGELALSVADRAMLEMWPAYRGVYITVATDGPFENFCMWGVTGDVTVQREIRVRPVDRDKGGFVESYRGQVIDHTLAGERVRFEASAPSEDAVTTLLGRFMDSRQPYA